MIPKVCSADRGPTIPIKINFQLCGALKGFKWSAYQKSLWTTVTGVSVRVFSAEICDLLYLLANANFDWNASAATFFTKLLSNHLINIFFVNYSIAHIWENNSVLHPLIELCNKYEFEKPWKLKNPDWSDTGVPITIWIAEFKPLNVIIVNMNFCVRSYFVSCEYKSSKI